MLHPSVDAHGSGREVARHGHCHDRAPRATTNVPWRKRRCSMRAVCGSLLALAALLFVSQTASPPRLPTRVSVNRFQFMRTAATVSAALGHRAASTPLLRVIRECGLLVLSVTAAEYGRKRIGRRVFGDQRRHPKPGAVAWSGQHHGLRQFSSAAGRSPERRHLQRLLRRHAQRHLSNDLFIGKPGGGATNRYVLETRGGIGQVPSGASADVGHDCAVGGQSPISIRQR